MAITMTSIYMMAKRWIGWLQRSASRPVGQEPETDSIQVAPAPERDPLWDELDTITDESAARIEPKFGHCPVCRRTGTAAFVFVTSTWVICDTCKTRWYAGDRLLRPVRDDDWNEYVAYVMADMTELEKPHE